MPDLVEEQLDRVKTYDVAYLKTTPFSNDEGREIYLRIWYPADIGDNLQSHIRANYDTGLLDEDFEEPFTAADAPELTSTAAWGSSEKGENPPVAEGKFPIVLVTPSYSLPPGVVFAPYAESMAAFGVVVVLVENTDDGMRCRLNPACTRNSFDALFPPTERLNVALTESRAADLELSLTEIERLNSDRDSRFYKKLNLNQIGLFGYSYGGLTHKLFLDQQKHDPRFKALLLVDPGYFVQESARAQDIKIPTLFVSCSFDGISNRCDSHTLLLGVTFAADPETATDLDGLPCVKLSPEQLTPLEQMDCRNAVEYARDIGTPRDQLLHLQIRRASHDAVVTCRFLKYLRELKAEGKLKHSLSDSGELEVMIDEMAASWEEADFPVPGALDATEQLSIISYYLNAFMNVYLLGNDLFREDLSLEKAEALALPIFYYTTEGDRVALPREEQS
jgi:hypothetical protein